MKKLLNIVLFLSVIMSINAYASPMEDSLSCDKIVKTKGVTGLEKVILVPITMFGSEYLDITLKTKDGNEDVIKMIYENVKSQKGGRISYKNGMYNISISENQTDIQIDSNQYDPKNYLFVYAEKCKKISRNSDF